MITNILIVDENVEMKAIIEDCLSSNDNLVLVGLAQKQALALKLTKKHKPNLIMLSEHFQGEQSLEIISALKEIIPAVCIIIMLLFAPSSYRQQAEDKGANGFVQYTRIYSDLLPEIHRVISGNPCT